MTPRKLLELYNRLSLDFCPIDVSYRWHCWAERTHPEIYEFLFGD